MIYTRIINNYTSYIDFSAVNSASENGVHIY